ncbi:MAG: hypothetical protein PHG05_00965 [Candidatus Nanoarchaeia archaeon]|nr:hypothetical protein [Candidatus Nanoarchaeia archaeon]
MKKFKPQLRKIPTTYDPNRLEDLKHEILYRNTFLLNKEETKTSLYETKQIEKFQIELEERILINTISDNQYGPGFRKRVNHHKDSDELRILRGSWAGHIYEAEKKAESESGKNDDEHSISSLLIPILKRHLKNEKFWDNFKGNVEALINDYRSWISLDFIEFRNLLSTRVAELNNKLNELFKSLPPPNRLPPLTQENLPESKLEYVIGGTPSEYQILQHNTNKPYRYLSLKSGCKLLVYTPLGNILDKFEGNLRWKFSELQQKKENYWSILKRITEFGNLNYLPEEDSELSLLWDNIPTQSLKDLTTRIDKLKEDYILEAPIPLEIKSCNPQGVF